MINKLLEQAELVSRNAYCPYSNFKVGCAILTNDHFIYVGCNFENAAYGSTICAERNAVGAMVAAGNQSGINTICIYVPISKRAYPCGACRQVLNEFSDERTEIVVACSGGYDHIMFRQLLPEPFGPKDLT